MNGVWSNVGASPNFISAESKRPPSAGGRAVLLRSRCSATWTTRRPQLQVGNAGRNVEAGLASDRNRLQRNRAVRSAHQHIGAEPHSEGGLAGRTDIAAGKRTAQRAG